MQGCLNETSGPSCSKVGWDNPGLEKKNRKTYYRLIRFAKQQQHQKELLIKTTKTQVAVFKTIFFYKSLQHKETSKFILRKIKLYDQKNYSELR